jgi:rhodanese-related sulfurtransferase
VVRSSYFCTNVVRSLIVDEKRLISSYTLHLLTLNEIVKMSDFNSILAQAHARAEQLQLDYAGTLTPQEALSVLQNDPNAVLVDVRTRAELELVGYIPFATHIEWATYPGMVANAHFADQLEMNINKESLVIFICRTGGRSHNAAMVAKSLGFDHAYNMVEGFEGEANSQKQRGLTNGWKYQCLPWTN